MLIVRYLSQDRIKCHYDPPNLNKNKMELESIKLKIIYSIVLCITVFFGQRHHQNVVSLFRQRNSKCVGSYGMNRSFD